MHIHHINCGTMCPIGGKLIKSIFPADVICHCWLIDTGDGLVLVDTGIGLQDVHAPGRLGATRRLLGFQLREEDTALHQVKALGYKPEDVRWIIPTHLDLDHAGGIADFPHAEVHIWEDEYNMARAQHTLFDRQRYRLAQWSGHERWRLHKELQGEPWFGFDAVRQVPGLPPELLMVPLPGHSFGHWCIALKQPDGWLFHVGDSYYNRKELTTRGPWSLRTFQRIIHHDVSAARQNMQRLQTLVDDHPEVTMVSAHDSNEFHRCCG